MICLLARDTMLACMTHLVRVQPQLQAGCGLSAELSAEAGGRAEGACILICQLARYIGQHIHRELQQACPGNQKSALSCLLFTPDSSCSICYSLCKQIQVEDCQH